jgi:hypothetical protein
MQSDLEAHPVWEYANRSDLDDDVIVPCRSVPVKDTRGKLFATQVRFANDSTSWAMLGNVDGRSQRMTQQFLSLSIIKDGRWFMLARYHDVAADRRNPRRLADFLGLNIDDVFPIHYDISNLASGHRWSLTGLIPKEPGERLSDSELIALSLE